jgi:hypothetical protein
MSTERKLPRVLTGFMLAFFAGTVLCLIAAFTILMLQSRHFNIDRPWFDPALAELKRLVTVLMLGTVVFKAAVQLYKR